jgi:flavin-binding protein dodecin
MEDPQAQVGTAAVMEITAKSGTNFETAIQVAIDSVSKDRRPHLLSFDVTRQRVNFADGRTKDYEVTVLATFVVGDKPFMW